MSSTHSRNGVITNGVIYEVVPNSREWIAKRFHIKTAHGWDWIIAFMGVSEGDAFILAKELWGQYLAEPSKFGVPKK